MAEILRGKPVVEKLKEAIKKEVEKYREDNIIPTMGIVRVGARSDDLAYERGIIKNCESVGIDVKVFELDLEIGQKELLDFIKKINEDEDIHGIMIFRPLPEQLDMEMIKHSIHPDKDIDAMNPINLGKVFEGSKEGFYPCTAEAVLEILKYYDIEISGKKVAIVNRSMVLGKPLGMMLLAENATITLCHSKTIDMPKITADADIVVTGVGRGKFFDAKYFSEQSIVIDVGINYVKNKLCGDVDYDAVIENVKAITPVPGGVGTVTSTILLKHVIEAVKKQRK